MNTPESDSSPSQPSGLQVELGATPPRRFRPVWLAALLVLLALVVAGVTLIGRSPARAPEPSPSPSVALQASPQPRITWSENQLDIILSPGQSASRSLTFTSSLDVQNIVIEPVPELASFVSIQPNGFANILAGQPQSVMVNYSIPADATLGDYDGTIHIRSAARTLPATLKVAITVSPLLEFVNAEEGYRIRYDPNFGVTDIDSNRSGFISGVHFSVADDLPNVSVIVYRNPSMLPIDTWYDATLADKEYRFPDATTRSSTFVLVGRVLSLQVRSTVLGFIKLRTFVPSRDRVFGIETSVPDDATVPDVYFTMLDTFQID